MKQAIAILDSGVGGLTVAKEVKKQLPQEKIVYFGDTSRAPYGPRSPHQVRLFTRQIVKFLSRMDPKMIVIACNTATAVALDFIRTEVTVPVIGVVLPGARAAMKQTKSKIVGVIGTEGTIRSGAYEQALHRMCASVQVYSKACPTFVPLVEKGLYHTDQAKEVVKEALAFYEHVPVDCLILGCTHYPFLDSIIAEVLGEEIMRINSAEETALEMKSVLQNLDLLATREYHPAHEFYCTGDIHVFKTIAEQWLDEPIQVHPVAWPTSKQS